MIFPEQFRQTLPGSPYESKPGDPCGFFVIPPQKLGRTTNSRALKVMASDGTFEAEGETKSAGWEHVSVSVMRDQGKCPTWDEMCLVKRLFWEPEELVVQFHPPESEYVSIHPGCLHLFRYTAGKFPQPPIFMV